MYNNQLFTIFDRYCWYIQHFNFHKRCSFSVPSWLEKEEQPSWLGKKGTPFCKMSMFKNHYFVVVHACNGVLRWFNNFLKNVSWGALHGTSHDCQNWVIYKFLYWIMYVKYTKYRFRAKTDLEHLVTWNNWHWNRLYNDKTWT